MLTSGLNANPGGVGPNGNYLTTIQYNGDATLSVVAPQAVGDRVLMFGDSISVGGQNIDAPNTAAVNKLRASGYSVMSEGSGSDWLGRWNQGTAAAPNFTALINRLVSYAPETIWVQMGHNDASRLSTSWDNNINYYANAYTSLIDSLHTALPNAHIFCQSVMATNPAVYNNFGDKQLQICGDSARKAYAAPVNARNFVTGYGAAGTYMSDQYHPNAAGDAMYANRIKEYLANLNPNISVTAGSDNFVENQANSNLEYTVADSSVNNDAKLANRLVKVSLNGNTVSSSDYSLAGTPAVLSLSQAYLNTLSSGTKNLDVYFTGNVKTSSSFTVAQDNSQAPSAPTNLTATRANTQVGLTWTAPSSDGGSAITDYVVQYKESSSSTWQTFNDGTSTNTNATVTGLTNGTQYDFRVRAVNSVGESPNSSTASAKPATTPSAPSLSATPETTGMKLTWTTPNSGGEAITDYTVQFKKTSASTWSTFNNGTSTGTTVTVTGLEPGVSYDFQVAAKNSLGTGSFSSPQTATTLANAIQLTNPESSQPIILTTPSSTDLTCHIAVRESSLAKQDSQFSYPLGLVDFCFDTSDSDNQVSLTFETSLKPIEVVARKYNPTTNDFAPISDASITETSINGNHALLLTYVIVDNGQLDLDSAIGSIKDPVGIAVNTVSANNGTSVKNASSDKLINTGSKILLPVLSGLGLIIFSVLVINIDRKKKHINVNK